MFIDVYVNIVVIKKMVKIIKNYWLLKAHNPKNWNVLYTLMLVIIIKDRDVLKYFNVKIKIN